MLINVNLALRIVFFVKIHIHVEYVMMIAILVKRINVWNALIAKDALHIKIFCGAVIAKIIKYYKTMNVYPVVLIAIVVTLKDIAIFVSEILRNIIYQSMEEIV